jgi:hypothetical protein
MSGSSSSSSSNKMKRINDFFLQRQWKTKTKKMALASNQRKSSIKACKAKASVPRKRRSTTTLKKKSNLKHQQMTMDGKRAEGRCDEATKKCRACEKLKTNPLHKSRGHDSTCPRSLAYKRYAAGRHG